MFADDRTFVESGKNTELKIDDVLQRITDWFTAIQLTVNIGNCEARKVFILNEKLRYKTSRSTSRWMSQIPGTH